MNSYLRNLYYPEYNSEYNSVQVNKNNVFEWKDKLNIKYNYHVNEPKTIFIDIDGNGIPSKIINHINSFQNIDTAIIKLRGELYDSNMMNHIFSIINKTIINKTIIFDLSDVRINSKIRMEIDSLPNNILFSMYDDNKKYEDNPKNEETPSDICWWAMNLNDNDFMAFCEHTTPETKDYILKMRKVAYGFYNQVKTVTPRMRKLSEQDKANIAYKWITSNIAYNSDEDYDDPLNVIYHQKGDCKGKSKLLKLLLNNYYMKVPCYIVKGQTITGKDHTWNEVYNKGKRLYYDISYAKKETPYINHTDIDHSDFNLSSCTWRENKISLNNKINKTEKKVSNR